jgi:hypothetical protein
MLRSLLIALLAALLVGAAVTSPSEAQGSWTCNWDFATSGMPSGWTLVYGSATGSGIKAGSVSANEAYALIEYTSGGTTFTSASVTFSASSSVGGPRYIDLGDLYTTSSDWTSSGSVTKSGSGSASTFSVFISDYTTGSANANMWIGSMSLSGTGSAPGGCFDATPTNTPVPPTATNTPLPPTATLMPMPTSTGVPYPTPGAFAPAAGDSYWGNTYNMAYGLQGWSLISGTLGAGRVVSANVSGVQRIEMEYPLGNVRLTDFFANYEATCAHTFEVKDGNTVFESGSLGSGMQAVVWQGSHVVSNGSVRLSLVGGSGCGASAFQLTEITLMGYGVNPTNLQATAIAIRAGDLYSGLGQVNTLLESLPASLGSSVPAETGRELFGYAKWLLSPSSADELAGPFAPIISHTGIFVTLVFGLTLVYAIVWAAVWIFRFVVWLFKIIMSIIQTVTAVIGSIFKFIF